MDKEKNNEVTVLVLATVYEISKFLFQKPPKESVEIIQNEFPYELEVEEMPGGNFGIYSTNRAVAEKLRKFMQEKAPTLRPTVKNMPLTPTQ